MSLFDTTPNATPNAPMTLDAWLSAAEGDASGLWFDSLVGDLMFPSVFVWGEYLSVGQPDRQAARDYFASTVGHLADDAPLVGVYHGLHAIAQAEFRQQAAHVRLDGGLAEEQPCGQLPVGQSAGQQQEHLPLAVGERGVLRRRRQGARVCENSSITRRVTAGSSSASPEATTRIARSRSSGGAVLSRNPLAPARSAS